MAVLLRGPTRSRTDTELCEKKQGELIRNHNHAMLWTGIPRCVFQTKLVLPAFRCPVDGRPHGGESNETFHGPIKGHSMRSTRWLPHGTARCTLLFLLGMIAMPAIASEKWEPTIVDFERQDREAPPPKHAVLFVGSSTVRKWDLKQYFPDIDTINRGFGGSQLHDVLEYLDRIVITYQPRMIFLYEGDNDINKGKTPEQLLVEFRQFADRVQHDLPETEVVFISIKPSLARWSLYSKIEQANALIANECQQRPRFHMMDVSPLTLGDDQRPRPDLFADDGLHLNDKGYELWSDLARTWMKAAQPASSEH